MSEDFNFVKIKIIYAGTEGAGWSIDIVGEVEGKKFEEGTHTVFGAEKENVAQTRKDILRECKKVIDKIV